MKRKAGSPSTRRAWIEIGTVTNEGGLGEVALHPEGVDRNTPPKNIVIYNPDVALHPEGVDRNNLALQDAETQAVALHPEGVDRNPLSLCIIDGYKESPSTRRAWIEIQWRV